MHAIIFLITMYQARTIILFIIKVRILFSLNDQRTSSPQNNNLIIQIHRFPHLEIRTKHQHSISTTFLIPTCSIFDINIEFGYHRGLSIPTKNNYTLLNFATCHSYVVWDIVNPKWSLDSNTWQKWQWSTLYWYNALTKILIQHWI